MTRFNATRSGTPPRAVWWPRRLATLAGAPGHLRPWLDEPGSLTRRLRARCDRGLTVRVCRNGWGRPLADECQRLGLDRRRRVWVREVLLCNGELPWVAARTVVPLSSLAGRLRQLRGLGTRPLGRLLFGSVPLTRGTIEIARLPADDARLEHAGPLAPDGHRPWARRSRFTADGRELLVCEVFLPTLNR